jgi:hypothetical protein
MTMFRRTFLAAIAGGLTLPAALRLPAQAAAGPTAVDLALVLAVDASMSIDESEAGTQRAGYIHALRDKRVGDAIKGGPIGRIALTYVEWSSPYHQTVIVPWRILKDTADATKFADELNSLPYKAGSTTSISGGIDFSVKLFASPEFEAARKVIDVSGDGYSDYGRPITVARDAAVKAGITINGLAVMNERPKWKQAAPNDLDMYYRDNVIGGPGSFYIAVRNLEDFSRSVLQKMVLEIAGLPLEPTSRG